MKTDNLNPERPALTITDFDEDDDYGASRSDAPNMRETKAAPPLKNADAPVPLAPSSTAQEPPAQSPKKRRVLLALGLAALGAGGYFGYQWLTVGRFLVSTDDAYVKADMSVISARVPGIVTDVAIKDNVAVHTNDVIAQIDDRDYNIAVQSAKAKLATQDATIARLKEQIVAQQALIEQAKAQVAAAKAGFVRAQADFERAETLAQQEFGSKQKLDVARADRDQSDASVKSADAAVLSATANLAVLSAQVKEAEGVRGELQSSLDKALLDLSFTTVKAPFDGIVGNKVVQIGQYAQSGTRLVSIVPLDKVYIDANYKETQLDTLRPGQPVEITVDAAGGRVYQGVVESIAPASGSQYSLLPPENATGNFTKIVQRVPVRIRVDGAAIRDGVLRPGLSVITYVNTKDGASSNFKVEADSAKPANENASKNPL